MNILKKTLLGLCLGGMLYLSSVSASAATDYSYTPKTQQTATPTPAPTAQSAADYYKEIIQNNQVNAIVLLGLCGALFVVALKNKTLFTKRRK